MSLVNYLDVYQDIQSSKEAVTKHHTNCANCGVAKGKTDETQLTPCHQCDLVSYCSDECMISHQEAHYTECVVRTFEIFEDWIFKQPEGSHLGDCPICFLPIPIGLKNSKFKVSVCCGKLICNGCIKANLDRMKRERQIERCVFCRKFDPKSVEEANKYLEERAEKNDPLALQTIAGWKYEERKYEEAASYYLKAAEFGDVESRYRLSFMYRRGEGVQKNLIEASQCLIEAALCGHPNARNYLGLIDQGYGRYNTAVKHFIIAATLGLEESLGQLKDLYKDGHASKEDYAGALRAYQAAVDATKSSMRDAAGLLVLGLQSG